MTRTATLLASASLALFLLVTTTEARAICCGAACCSIDGACRTSGATNPSNPCEECDPASSQTSWTAISGCTPPDAGPPAMTDAGRTTPPPSGGGGCSVGTRPGTLAALGGALVGLALAYRRRRAA